MPGQASKKPVEEELQLPKDEHSASPLEDTAAKARDGWYTDDEDPEDCSDSYEEYTSESDEEDVLQVSMSRRSYQALRGENGTSFYL